MASSYVIAMGTVIGVLTWIFLAFKVPGVPFGRTLGTLGGAVLVVVFNVLSPSEAFASINVETIALLFGTMILSVLLQREGFFDHFIRVLTWRCTTARSLLARLCVAAGFLSALLTNDTVCVFFTPVVVELCERHELPHGPFLLALATSTNIGSSATPVGNPQNMIIASLSGISYGQFIIYIGPAAVICLAINIGCLSLWYHKDLSGKEIRMANAKFVRATEEEIEAIRKTKQFGVARTIANPAPPSIVELQPSLRRRAVNQHDDSAPQLSLPLQPSSASNSLEEQAESERESLNGDHNGSSVLHRADPLPELKQDQQSSSISIHDAASMQPSSPCVDAPFASNNDSVTLMIQQMQREYWRERLDGGHGSVKGADDSSKQAKTRVATWNHPRRTGRTLIMQPPVLMDAASRALDRQEREAGADPENQANAIGCCARCLLPATTDRLRQWIPSKLLLFFLVLLGTIGAFAGGANLGWAALGGAAAMLVADWCDPDKTIAQVDWSLLVFFSSLFIVTAGFSATELPNNVWDALKSDIDVGTAMGSFIYSIIIVIGSNTVSNVPLVLLLGPSIPTLSDPQTSWLLLSYVSTVAGNLTLVGSVANLIVCARAKQSYLLQFYEYLRFGFPTTLLTTTVGVIIVKAISSAG